MSADPHAAGKRPTIEFKAEPWSLGTHTFDVDGMAGWPHFTGDFREDRDAFDFALGLAVALGRKIVVRVALAAGAANAWRGIGHANPDGTGEWKGEGWPLASALADLRATVALNAQRQPAMTLAAFVAAPEVQRWFTPTPPAQEPAAGGGTKEVSDV